MRKPLLLLPWAIAAFLLIQTAAGSFEYDDDDITFDDVPTRPEGPGRPPESGGIASYLHSSLSRIKRGIFDIWGSDEKSSEEPSEDEVTKAPTPTMSSSILTPSPQAAATSPDGASHRETRSTSSDLKSTMSDDEDDGVTASGSGSPWEHPVIAGSVDEPYTIFRIKMFLHEFWIREYANKHSPAFERFAQNFTKELVQFFDAPVGDDGPLPGSRRATVIGIDPSREDTMLILVTSDLGSKGTSDGGEIKKRLRRHLTATQRLGSYPVKVDDKHPLTVQQFTVPNPSGFSECEANQVVCKDGTTCLPIETRCNGASDCPDGEDEEECPSVEEETVQSITIAPDSRSINAVAPAPTSEEPEASAGESPRCDDAVTCPDGFTKICDTQVCDGVQDCPGESEESNCPIAPGSEPTTTTTTTARPPQSTLPSDPECMEGEFMCDVSRCILMNKKCDGVRDCNDGTDEETDCPPRREYRHLVFSLSAVLERYLILYTMATVTI